MFYADTPNFDNARFCESFNKSDCYWAPLKLEDGKKDTFLETTFEITEANTIRHWLKNENEIGKQPKTWRYAHFRSYATFEAKKEGGAHRGAQETPQDGKRRQGPRAHTRVQYGYTAV